MWLELKVAYVVSGGQVNCLIDRFGCERLPTIDLTHVGLSRGKQSPNQHGCGVGRWQTVCVLIRRLNSSCSRSIALMVRALFHRLGGSRVKVNSRSPASSSLSATA
jgi:hypothetical protein